VAITQIVVWVLLAIFVLIKLHLYDYEYKEIIKKYDPKNYRKYSLLPKWPGSCSGIENMEIRDACIRLTRKKAIFGGVIAVVVFALSIIFELLGL
jgi:hypothetical protein